MGISNEIIIFSIECVIYNRFIKSIKKERLSLRIDKYQLDTLIITNLGTHVLYKFNYLSTVDIIPKHSIYSHVIQTLMS